MKKYILIALFFTTLATSGCRSLVRNADEMIGGASKIAKTVDPPNINPPNINSTKKAAGALKAFIQSSGRNGKAAGMNYVRYQQSSGNLISKSTLEQVVYQTILEEVDKTALQLTRAEIRDITIEITTGILVPLNSDEVTE